MKLRKIAFSLHRYMGLMVGLLLIIIGLTGSSLVFWHEINHFLNPRLFHVVPQEKQISPQSVLNRVRSNYPDLQLTYLELPEKLDGVYEVGMQSKSGKLIYLYLNPYTGAILGSQQWGRTLMTFIYDIHITLLAGEFGGIIVGSCGVVLVILGITGLILWPGWKKLLTGFKIRWNSPAQIVNYDIHKVSGIFSAAFLILIALTGAAMIFYTQFESTVYWLTGTPTPSTIKSTIVAGKKPMNIDKILQKADAALPGAKTTMISLPAKPNDVVRVTKKFPQAVIDSGRSRVYLDRYSGKVLRVENALTAPLAYRILNSLFNLHIGAYGGLPMRILYVFIGLVPTVLSVTGWVLWRKRQWAIARRFEAMRQLEMNQSQPEKESLWVHHGPWF